MRSSNVTSTAAPSAPGPGTVRYGLQPVQHPDAGHVSLPSSVARSADGEEGAVEYNRRLYESNIHPASVETRSDCQQVPPNRTVSSSWQDDDDDDLSHRLPSHSTSTSRTKSRTVDAVGLTPVRAPSRQTAKLLSGDYVSSSELTTWRSSLTRTGRMQAPPPITVEEAAATMAREKPRSGSADSVCRRFIKFTRRLISTSRMRKSPPLVSSRSGSDDGNDLISPTSHSKPEEEFEEGSGGAVGRKVPPEPKPSHWELPPNYVDMIFTRSLAGTGENEGGGEQVLVTADKKQQQLQQLQQQLQQHEGQQKHQQLLKHRQKEQAERSRTHSNVRTSPKV